MGSIPRNLAVVGGGVIGCEYASIFTALGAEVSLVDGRDRVLPFLDAEISACLRERLAELGVRFFFGERTTQIERAQNKVRITLQSGKTHRNRSGPLRCRTSRSRGQAGDWQKRAWRSISAATSK